MAKLKRKSRVRCSAGLGVIMDACLTKRPTDSGLRKIRVGMARAVWHLWLRLRAFLRAQNRQRNVPLRRSVLLLLDPAAYILWPHPTKWPKLTPAQKLARWWVKIVGRAEANQTRREDRIGHPTPAQIAQVMPYVDW